jgi:hypothetical protein
MLTSILQTRCAGTYATQKSCRTAVQLVQHVARAGQQHGGIDHNCRSRAASELPLLGCLPREKINQCWGYCAGESQIKHATTWPPLIKCISMFAEVSWKKVRAEARDFHSVVAQPIGRS